MLQVSIAATCCLFLICSSVHSEDAKWSKESTAQSDRRIDDWVPVTDPCPTCKRQLIGDHQQKRQSDDISSLLTPPAFGKPRFLPLSSGDPFYQSNGPKGQNSITFPQNRPFTLRQTNSPNFFQQQQQNPFISEQKTPQFFSPPDQKQPQFFSPPQSQQSQSFSFQQPPFFIPQTHFPIPSQPQPQFNFAQQTPAINNRPQSFPPQSASPVNNRLPPKPNTFPGVVTPVQIQNSDKEEVQLLYVPIETLQKNKLKEFRPFGKQSTEKVNSFPVSPAPQSIVKDQRFQLPVEQLNQRESKQNGPQFGNPPPPPPPSSFHFQQIGDNKFTTSFSQNFRQPEFQTFQQAAAAPPAPPAFINNETPSRFEFENKFSQPTAAPVNELKQVTPSFTSTFSQFSTPTLPPTPAKQTVTQSFTSPQYTPLPQQSPPPHQPPLAVYMERTENSKVFDVLGVLKAARTIPVLDQVEDQAPSVFVGPSSLDPPKGYVKFELPYLSSFETNRLERKVEALPFFVAPLNFKPPAGYSKIPFPAPHIGSVVISNSTVFKDLYEKPSTSKPFTSFEFTTKSAEPQFLSTQDSRFNEIPSSTPPTTPFKQFTTVQSFETNPPSFDFTVPSKLAETNPPSFDFTVPSKPVDSNPPKFEEQFTRKPAFEQSEEKTPTFEERRQPLNFKSGQFEFPQEQFSPPQFENSRYNFETLPPQQQETSRPQFEITPSQISNQNIQYQFEQDINQQSFRTNQPQFDEPKQTTHSQFETARFPANQQFDVRGQNQIGFNQQFTNEETFSTSKNNQSAIPDIQTFHETSDVRQNDFSPQQNEQQQPQFDFSTRLPQIDTTEKYETVPTTTRLPRRKITRTTTTTTEPHYKSSTPPPSYNPRRNRKPLYRGLPKNSADIQATTLSTRSTTTETSTPEFNNNNALNNQEQPSTTERVHFRRPLYRGQLRSSADVQATTLSLQTTTTEAPLSNQYDFNNQQEQQQTFTERVQNNQINSNDDSFLNRFRSTKTLDFQTSSETYFQPELENTVLPINEQRFTENYPRTEKPEEPTLYTKRQRVTENYPRTEKPEEAIIYNQRQRTTENYPNTEEPVFYTQRPKITENYPRTEKPEEPLTTLQQQNTFNENYPITQKFEEPLVFTQQTPNYSNFQGINQFFNQVIQKENTVGTEEATLPVEPVSSFTARPEQTFNPSEQVSSEKSEQSTQTEISSTEAAAQSPVTSNEKEFSRRPNFSERRNKYRPKSQSTTSNVELSQTSDSPKETSETEKPLRKKIYRSRQRVGSRNQFRTSTSTEITADENIPQHFSSLRGQNTENSVSGITETQSTSTESPSTRVDAAKYGTFKRRRPTKTYERTSVTTSTEGPSASESETLAPSTRSFRPRARTTPAPAERITRVRARRPFLSSTTPELVTVEGSTEIPVRQAENNNVDWGTFANSFNPSAQGNDVLSPLEDQNTVSKPENTRRYPSTSSNTEKSTSFDSTSPVSVSVSVSSSSHSSKVPHDRNRLFAQERRKFSARKPLNSETAEADHSNQEKQESQPDSVNTNPVEVKSEDAQNAETNFEDKSVLKENDSKKASDPSNGKKFVGRKRGQWVRVRSNKPNQEYFETAESQNVPSLGNNINNIQNPTKESFPKAKDDLIYLQPLNEKNVVSSQNNGSQYDSVYFTSTTERSEEYGGFDLEKGVSAMIAEFMNVEDEAKDNAQETFENTDQFKQQKDDQKVSDEEKSIEKSSSGAVDGTFEITAKNTLRQPAVQNTTESFNQEENILVENGANLKNGFERNVQEDQTENKAAEHEAQEQNNQNEFNQKSYGNIETKYYESVNEGTEEKEAQPKEREIKSLENGNLKSFEFSNHKYDGKIYESDNKPFADSNTYVAPVDDSKTQSFLPFEESKTQVFVPREDSNIDSIVPSGETSVPSEVRKTQASESLDDSKVSGAFVSYGESQTQTFVPSEDTKVQDENLPEISSTDLPEPTTNAPDSEIVSDDLEVNLTTELPFTKIVTSKTTEVSLETEICYKGRCIKSKKKRPSYKDFEN